MEYGTLLGVSLDNSEQSSLQSLITKYYSNPLMTKLLDTPVESHYYCKINTKLLNEHRYIIAITKKDNNRLQTKKYLKNISWISFQSRSISRNYNINSINYNSNILDKIYLKSTENNKKYTTYTCQQYPELVVYVLNKIGHLYPPEATLCNALEEFSTLINIKN